MKIFLIILCLPFWCMGQSEVGVVRYGEIQSMGMGAPVGADYNAILVFNKASSLFITRQDSLEGGYQYRIESYGSGQNYFMNTYVTNEMGFRYYNDNTKGNFYSRDIGFKLVKEKTPKISWSLLPETKTIGKFTCKKATAKFRGRTYTAWYTTQIPLPYGPWKLQGLPGIILEAYDTNKEIYWYFKSLEYPGNFARLLKKIPNKNNQWLTFQQYKEAMVKNFQETIINSRMASQSAGIETQDSSLMLNSYIEGFEVDMKN